MKGLELCENYFIKHGLPMISRKFASFKGRIAAGLVGDGSECYGFDDEISRDHDWGPSFCLWLTKDDFEQIGQQLQKEYDNLPDEFEGFSRIVSEFGEGRVGVFEIGEFYKKFIGISRLPEKLNEWFPLPESYLAACTNGKVFYDPLGEFTYFRNKLLEFYPEDIRLKKMAARCMAIAQNGQYNYLRCAKRHEYVAAQYAESKFYSDVISLVFLINKRYMPYFKWMHRAVRDLPILGENIYQTIFKAVTTSDSVKKYRLMEDICETIIGELRRENLSDSRSESLLDHGPAIQSGIKEPRLKNLSVWLGGP